MNPRKSQHPSFLKPWAFSVRLTRNFILCMCIPFVLVFLLAYTMIDTYNTEVLSATQSHMKSISQNIEVYLKELQQVTLMPYYDSNFSLFLSQSNTQKTLSYPERMRIQQSLRNTIDFIRFTRTDLQSVIIVRGEECLFYSTELINTTPLSSYDYTGQAWYQSAMAANGSVAFISPHTQDYFSPATTEEVFSLVRALKNLQSRETYAVIKVDATSNVFKTLLDTTQFYVDSAYYLCDANGRLIYSSGIAPALKEAIDASPHALDGALIQTKGQSYLHKQIAIPEFDWSFHVLLNNAAIASRHIWVYYSGFLLYLAGTAISLITYLRLSQKMVLSVRSIRKTLVSLQEGDLDARYSLYDDDELSIVGESINQMAGQLSQLIQEKYISTIRQQEAEMRALQSQIRPHFLFNVLGNFLALSQNHEQARLEASLISLSLLMRYVLDKRPHTTLGDEVAFIKHYLDLQQLRFGERLTYRVHVTDEAAAILLPRLVLQPFIENAVLHGIEPCAKPCTVSVSAYRNENHITIEIADDGVGFDTNAVPSEGIGNANSISRLKLMYPLSGIQVTSNPQQGCQVIISLECEVKEYESINRG